VNDNGYIQTKAKNHKHDRNDINDRKSERNAKCCRRHAGKTFYKPMVLGGIN
jgi:hypothetical protein